MIGRTWGGAGLTAHRSEPRRAQLHTAQESFGFNPITAS